MSSKTLDHWTCDRCGFKAKMDAQRDGPVLPTSWEVCRLGSRAPLDLCFECKAIVRNAMNPPEETPDAPTQEA